MTTHEHLLTIVEPTPGGDGSLAVAHQTVERGGTARVVMLITDRVRRDIREFARSENLHQHVAEAMALDRLREYYAVRVGGSPTVDAHFGNLAAGMYDHLTPETTAIAVPEHLAGLRTVRRIVAKTGIPMVITPNRAA